MNQYIERELFRIDPITELSRVAIRPFYWSEVESLMRLRTGQKEFLEELAKADVGDGLAFQVFGPLMRNGYVGLGLAKACVPLDPVVVHEVQFVCQAAHLRYCELFPLQGVEPGSLSKREVDVLNWIARGKSNGDIAAILDVSRHTVDTVIRRIFAKLGVADRTRAALHGVASGLIMP